MLNESLNDKKNLYLCTVSEMNLQPLNALFEKNTLMF